MDPKIVGTVMPVLEMNMQPNEKVFAESGQLSWMSMAIQMQTSTTAGGQQGGFLGALGRAVAGGTLFMTEYTAAGGPGLLAFAAKLPGQILPLEIAPGYGYMVHRHGFMCGTPGIQVSTGWRSWPTSAIPPLCLRCAMFRQRPKRSASTWTCLNSGGPRISRPLSGR